MAGQRRGERERGGTKKKKREKVRGGGYRVEERWGKERSVDELVDG
jgi:hypothetical protein